MIHNFIQGHILWTVLDLLSPDKVTSFSALLFGIRSLHVSHLLKLLGYSSVSSETQYLFKAKLNPRSSIIAPSTQ